VSEASEFEASGSAAGVVVVVPSLSVSIDDRIESIGVASVVAEAVVAVVAEKLDVELLLGGALTL